MIFEKMVVGNKQNASPLSLSYESGRLQTGTQKKLWHLSGTPREGKWCCQKEQNDKRSLRSKNKNKGDYQCEDGLI